MKIEQLQVIDLIPFINNSRTHSDEQVAQVAASIKEFGFTNPILIDGDNGIIAGHGRLMAARKLSIETVPCIRLAHLSEAQRRAYVIADNKLALNAGWDDELLSLELGELKEMDFDLSLIGFSDDELAGLLVTELEDGLTDEDAVPEPPETPTTVEGDVWVLGNHRLMCGDSTSIDTVDKLMDGNKADMVFTDPPYGIGYSGAKYDNVKSQNQGLSTKRNFAPMILGDDTDFDPSFLLTMFHNVRDVFVWGYQYYPDKLGRGGIIVWNKKTESQSECAHGDFELCWSKRERNRMCWLTWGGFKNKEKGEDRLHTTQKPVALVEWFFDNWAKPNDLIVDLFGGSGSTLIACEKNNRSSRLMELDPKYCDVIIKRWQEFTGKQAINEATGEAYKSMEVIEHE